MECASSARAGRMVNAMAITWFERRAGRIEALWSWSQPCTSAGIGQWRMRWRGTEPFGGERDGGVDWQTVPAGQLRVVKPASSYRALVDDVAKTVLLVNASS